MKRNWILVFSLIASLSQIQMSYAQGGYYFGIKGGLSLCSQRWNSFNSRLPLYAPHGDLFIESYEEDQKYALLAQLGYHQRGSANRFFFPTYNSSGQISGYINRSDAYRFNNAVLTLAAKQFFKLGEKSNAYYIIGLRGEYTFSSNLPSIDELTKTPGYFGYYSPVSDYIRHWNYGAVVGGGFIRKISDYVEGFLEFNVSPDLSRQYYEPPIQNAKQFDPLTGAFQTTTISEQNIRNFSFEITLGLRFLRKIIYVD